MSRNTKHIDCCVTLLAVLQATKLVTAIIINVQESGTIWSYKLDKDTTYEYKFSGYASDNTLIIFNVTRMKNLQTGDFKIYDDPVSDVSCLAFHERGDSQSSTCKELWKQKFGSCVSNTGATKNIKVTFKRRGTKQILEVDYKIINCVTGATKLQKANSNKTEKVEREMETTSGKAKQQNVNSITSEWVKIDKKETTTSANDPKTIGLATILPIAFSVVFIMMVLAVLGYTCVRKTSKATARVDSQEPNRIELESHVYEEIAEQANVVTTSYVQDGPYNHIELVGKLDVGYGEMSFNSAYDSMGPKEMDNADTPVVGLLPPRNKIPKSN